MFVYDKYFKEKEHNIIGFLICFITYVLLMLVFLCNKCPCCLCEILLAIDGFLIWIYCEILNFYDSEFNTVEEYLKARNIGGVKEWLLKRILTDKKLEEEDEGYEEQTSCRDSQKDSVIIAKTLIKTAINNETITFSGLCETALKVKWKGRRWLKYIARRLDIIGQCCKENNFPFINGLTREKYSYKINSGFWQPFWKDLLPIKSYEEQTEENVKKFQQEIFDKIGDKKKNEIEEFLKKLKTFEPI